MDGHANHPQRASVTLGSFGVLVRVLAYLSEHARGLPRIGASTCYPFMLWPARCPVRPCPLRAGWPC